MKSSLSLTIFATLSLAFGGLLVSFEAQAADTVKTETDAKTATKTETETKTGTQTENTKTEKLQTETQTKTQTDSTKRKKGEKAVSKTDAHPVVVMETSKGTIEIELNAEKAPITVANFLKYVDKHQYDGLIFHRVIPNFMIQGGGFSPDMKEKGTDKPIKNEATNGLSNKRGTIAMARTMVVDSASAQFFINHKDNAFLDNHGTDMQSFGYAVFGEVKSGMEVVDAIAKVATGVKNGMENVPTEPVVIKSLKRK